MRHLTLALTLLAFQIGASAQQKDFEGIIYYSLTPKPMLKGLTATGLMNRLIQDESSTCYVRNGDYKWETAKVQSWIMHKDKKQYLKFPGIDTLYYIDCTIDTSRYEIRRLSDKQTIAGLECNTVELKSGAITKTYYYSPALYINPDYSKGMKIDGIELVARETASACLKMEFEHPLFSYVQEARRYEPVAVPADVFKIPDLPATAFRSENFEESPSFGTSADAWERYIRNNINADLALKHIKLRKGEDMAVKQVIVAFLIDDEGNVHNAAAENGSDVPAALAREAVRVVSQSPPWTPAKLLGRNVFKFMRLPVTFAVAR